MKTKDAKKKMCPFSVCHFNGGTFTQDVFNGPMEVRSGVWFKTRCTTVECMGWIETEKDEGFCGMIPVRPAEDAPR